MLHLLISCDDPMERLLYGEPDPWLRSFECRVTPGTPGWNDLPPEDQQRILDYVNSGGALTPEQQEWLNQYYDQGAPEPSCGVDIQDGDAIAEGQREWGREWDEQQETYDSYAAGTGGYEPAGSTSALERQVDAFLVDQAQPNGADAADLLWLDSSPRSHSDTSEKQQDEDEVEELIRRRGRALGLSEAQIVSAIARYRTSAGRLRVGAASAGLANAVDPATALLGAGVAPPEAQEASYQEALERYNAHQNVPLPAVEDDDGEYIDSAGRFRRRWERANNNIAIELAQAAVASGRPVPDGLILRGIYSNASLSDAATPVELAQLVTQWRESESDAERADDPDGGGGGGSSREYAVSDDGAVSFVEDGRTYQVSDDDLAQDVREAAATGDASGLSSVDQVTVSTGDDGPVAAANYNVGGDASEGNYGSLRASQEAWFREQLANPAGRPGRGCRSPG